MELCHDFMKEQMVLNCRRKLSSDRDPINALFWGPDKHPHYMLTKVFSERMLLQSLHCINYSNSCEHTSFDQNSAGSGVDIIVSSQRIEKIP